MKAQNKHITALIKLKIKKRFELDKTKQYVALIGGALGALLLFFQSLGYQVEWFNEDTIKLYTGCIKINT